MFATDWIKHRVHTHQTTKHHWVPVTVLRRLKPSYEYLLIKPTPFHNMPHLKGLSELNLQQILITCDKKTYEAQTHTTVLSVKLPCSSSN